MSAHPIEIDYSNNLYRLLVKALSMACGGKWSSACKARLYDIRLQVRISDGIKPRDNFKKAEIIPYVNGSLVYYSFNMSVCVL